MRYRVEIAPPAQRGLARLPGKVAGAVISYLDRLADAPYRMTKPLSGDLAGLISARNGDYRVLCEIVDDPPLVVVVRVDHRAHIYRSR